MKWKGRLISESKREREEREGGREGGRESIYRRRNKRESMQEMKASVACFNQRKTQIYTVPFEHSKSEKLRMTFQPRMEFLEQDKSTHTQMHVLQN